MVQLLAFYSVNLEVLRDEVARPDRDIHLDAFVDELDSRLRCCPARIVAELPHFRALGVLSASGYEHGPVMRGPRGDEWTLEQTVDHLFGMIAEDRPFDVLFMRYGHGARDRDLIACLGGAPTHKALALARLDLALELLTGKRAPHAPWLSVQGVREAAAKRLAMHGWSALREPAIGTKAYATAVGQKEAIAYLSGPDGYHYGLSGHYYSEGSNALEANGVLIPRVVAIAHVDDLVDRFAKGADRAISQTYAATLLRLHMTPERMAQAARFHADNIDLLVDAVLPMRDDAISLDSYRDVGEKGIRLCLGGVVAVMPAFAVYGVGDYAGVPRMPDEYGMLMSAEDTLNQLFGDLGTYGDDPVTAFRVLFAQRGNGSWDEILLKQFGSEISDKELGLARLYMARKRLARIAAAAPSASSEPQAIASPDA